MIDIETIRAINKDRVIDACQELLDCEMAAGARLAIPGTEKLILIGAPDWIAENVPDVEAKIVTNGGGKLREYLDRTAEQAERVSCPECSGTGSVMMDGDCEDCNGKGYHWESVDLAAPSPVSEAQAETSGAAMHDVVIDLREYSSNAGYSHSDYADTMRQAASCIESLRALIWNFGAVISAPAPTAKEAEQASVQAAPTDISRKLRRCAAGYYEGGEGYRKLMADAADEIERYYGGMLNWKRTAEEKDASAQAAEVRDAARYHFLREKMCFSGGATEPTMMSMSARIPAPTHDFHADWVGDRFDASVDATVDAALRNAVGTGEQA